MEFMEFFPCPFSYFYKEFLDNLHLEISVEAFSIRRLKCGWIACGRVLGVDSYHGAFLPSLKLTHRPWKLMLGKWIHLPGLFNQDQTIPSCIQDFWQNAHGSSPRKSWMSCSFLLLKNDLQRILVAYVHQWIIVYRIWRCKIQPCHHVTIRLGLIPWETKKIQCVNTCPQKIKELNPATLRII